MKNVAEVEKNERKVFTEKKGNSRIRKNYNPLKVNCKIYRRRDGLYKMKKVKLNEAKKEISSKYGIKEKVVAILFEKCKKENYTINESKRLIVEFLKTSNLSKTCPLI